MENYEEDYLKVIRAYQALPGDMQEKFQKQTGLIPRPKSIKFERTGISVTSPAEIKPFTQQDIYNMLCASGKFDIVDGDIGTWEFDNNPEYNGCEPVTGVLDKFINDIKHRDIIAEGQMLQTHLQVNLLQGALLAIELVKSGAINEKGKGVIIYLTETKDGVSCRLRVWRYDVGNVEVFVNEVSPDRGCNAGAGVLSSN